MVFIGFFFDSTRTRVAVAVTPLPFSNDEDLTVVAEASLLLLLFDDFIFRFHAKFDFPFVSPPFVSSPKNFLSFFFSNSIHLSFLFLLQN